MVAGAAEKRVVLIYDGQQLECDASLANRRGGFRALHREAELTWGLHPKSYIMSDALGKVDSQEALQRTLQGASDGGLCVLDVREHPEWKAFRMSMATLESKIMAKVDDALACLQEDMKQIGTTVNGTVAPLLKCMSVEMVEVRTRIQQAETVLCQSISPMMQQLAEEQLDLRAKCAAVCDGVVPLVPLVPLVKCVALEQLELRDLASKNCSRNNRSDNQLVDTAHEGVDTDVDNSQERLGSDVSHRLSHLEQADEFLFHEFQELQRSTKAAELDLREVREEVKVLIDNPENIISKQVNVDPDARFGWKEPLPNSIPFSSKLAAGIVNGGGQLKKGGAAWKRNGSELSGVAPSFARGPPIRAFERMEGSRSTPHLPPLM